MEEKVEEQLEAIAKSYDRGIDLGRKKGIVSYDALPSYITNNPNYPLYEQARMNELPSDSA